MDVLYGLISLGSLVIAGLALYFTNQQNKRMLYEAHRKEERDEINKKLDEFLGPYQQLLETSEAISNKLRENKPEGWRTLTALLNGEKLVGNDKFLFEHIMDITNQIEDIRIKHGGLIDDEDLRKLLAKAGAHFRILKSAYKGEISGEVSRFADYVYPRGLNSQINDVIKALKDKREKLRNDNPTDVIKDDVGKVESDETPDVTKDKPEESGNTN
jgi:hypothetical protein